jgi:hypothetical protein
VKYVEILVLRLALPVITIMLATAVQRRLGHQLGGRLVGLPLTTCPVLLILLRTEGSTATANAAAGVTAGQLVVATFCLCYGRLGHRLRNAVTAMVATLTATVGVLAVASKIASMPIAAALVLTIVVVGLLTWPPLDVAASTTMNIPRWETTLRVVATTSMVAGLTAAARVLGSHLAGLLACTPVVLCILTPTTHRRWGFPAAAALTRGALCSVPGTLTFGLIIAYTLQPLGAAMAFPAAVVGLLIADHAFRRLVSSASAMKSAAPQNTRLYSRRRTQIDVVAATDQQANAQHYAGVDQSTEVTNSLTAATSRQLRQTG